jgi:hypothetical protein
VSPWPRHQIADLAAYRHDPPPGRNQPSITRTKEEAIAILQGYEQTIKQDLSQFPKLGASCSYGTIEAGRRYR